MQSGMKSELEKERCGGDEGEEGSSGEEDGCGVGETVAA
jgi:hypothetical protein